jgi:DNA (cytosine-5)-methyltransferase 1
MGRLDAESETLIPTIGGVFDVAHTLRGEGFDASEDGSGRGTPLVPVAFAHQAGGIQTTLGYDPDAGTSSTLSKCQTPAIDTGIAVRRLTPTECERLQGFADGYTDIRHGGKATPDGPRYKALGNSMAIPPMRWLGQRIALVDSIQALQAAA